MRLFRPTAPRDEVGAVLTGGAEGSGAEVAAHGFVGVFRFVLGAADDVLEDVPDLFLDRVAVAGGAVAQAAVRRRDRAR
jgi:hypothetical protein